MTANLRAPIVVNRRGRLARQIILAGEQYPLRRPLFAPASEPVVAA
jgi:flagellar assembly factor FliW